MKGLIYKRHLLLLLLLIPALSGCKAIAAIYVAGMKTGIFIALFVLIFILWQIRKLSK